LDERGDARARQGQRHLDLAARRGRRPDAPRPQAGDRPLLRTADPEATLRALLATRAPVYALADLVIDSRDAPHEAVVGDLIAALDARLDAEGCA
jgi:hypothetical protein